jgi:hypothetical protein
VATAVRTFSTMTPFGVVPSRGTSRQAQTISRDISFTNLTTLCSSIAESVLCVCVSGWFVPLSRTLYPNGGNSPRKLSFGKVMWVATAVRIRFFLPRALLRRLLHNSMYYYTKTNHKEYTCSKHYSTKEEWFRKIIARFGYHLYHLSGGEGTVSLGNCIHYCYFVKDDDCHGTYHGLYEQTHWHITHSHFNVMELTVIHIWGWCLLYFSVPLFTFRREPT